MRRPKDKPAEVEQPEPRSRHLRFTSLTLVGMIVLATGPFLGKAFHLDDYYYIQIARQILTDPTRPYDFEWINDGQRQYVFTHHRSPPLFNYALAAGIRVFGEREVPLHCMMSVFTAGVAASAYSLARRFSARPLEATALVVLSPLFVPGQNVMLDVPMLALGLGGLACHVWGTDRSRGWLVLIGGLLVGLASVTKYPALVLFPLMAIYSLERRNGWLWPGLAVGLVPLAGWCVQNLVCDGQLHLRAEISGSSQWSWSELHHRLPSVLTILGSGFFPLLAAPRFVVGRGWHVALLLLSLLAATAWRMPGLELSTMPVLRVVQHVVFLASGLFLVALSLAAYRRAAGKYGAADARDSRFLLVWLASGLLVVLVLAPFVAVRSALWALPPAALLATRVVDSSKLSVAALRAMVVVVAVLGLALGWADMEFANLQRRMVHEISPPEPWQPRVTYFSGQDGFAHYCTALGMVPITDDVVSLPAGTRILSCAVTALQLSPELRQRLRETGHGMERGRVPLNTVSHGVSFYRTGNYDLPWELFRPSEVYLDGYYVRRSPTPR